jgi:hypothetical protein
MKTRFLRFTLLFLFVLSSAGYALSAKKMSYTMTIYKLILNGDTLEEAVDVQLTGIMKKHTKRLKIIALEDNSTLHAELWVTKEGVAAKKFTVIQTKYYTKKDEYWKLMAVAPRLKFEGDHLDRGHYSYNDRVTGESMEIFYRLTIVTVKKSKKKKKKK